eukprot:2123847-Pleurochrysis_carterae.AAC.1
MSECALMRAKAAFQDFSAAQALETSAEQHCNACCSSKCRMPASMRRLSWDADGGVSASAVGGMARVDFAAMGVETMGVGDRAAGSVAGLVVRVVHSGLGDGRHSGVGDGRCCERVYVRRFCVLDWQPRCSSCSSLCGRRNKLGEVLDLAGNVGSRGSRR